jgi:hypothetical protein
MVVTSLSLSETIKSSENALILTVFGAFFRLHLSHAHVDHNRTLGHPTKTTHFQNEVKELFESIVKELLNGYLFCVQYKSTL